jgi:hypothetical protein
MLYIVDTGSELFLQIIATSTLRGQVFRFFTCFVLVVTGDLNAWWTGTSPSPLCSRSARGGRGFQVASDSVAYGETEFRSSALVEVFGAHLLLELASAEKFLS